MRIGIDGYNLAMPHGTGVATYGYTLGHTLKSLGHQVEGVFGVDAGRDAVLAEVLFFDRLVDPRPERGRWRRRLGAARSLARVRMEEVSRSGTLNLALLGDRLPPLDRIWTSPALFDRAHRFFATTGRFTSIVVPDPPEVMHWTYPVPVRMEGARNVYTVHDLVPLSVPGSTLDDKRRYRRLLDGCVANADVLCTVSSASRDEIVATLGVDPDFVTCTYQVSPMRFETRTTEPRGARQFGLEEQGYFLFYGAIEPKKNLGRLLEAYLSAAVSTPLVIVSGRGWKSGDSLYLLPDQDNPSDPRHRSLADRIVRMDYLPRTLLSALVGSARAVLFPSLSEGFGLPAHEAMLMGTPVLASTAGALPEVVGDGGLLVDPYDVGAMRDAIERLDSDSALRASLAVAGREQAERYTCEAYGRALCGLYERALGAAA